MRSRKSTSLNSDTGNILLGDFYKSVRTDVEETTSMKGLPIMRGEFPRVKERTARLISRPNSQSTPVRLLILFDVAYIETTDTKHGTYRMYIECKNIHISFVYYRYVISNVQSP